MKPPPTVDDATVAHRYADAIHFDGPADGIAARTWAKGRRSRARRRTGADVAAIAVVASASYFAPSVVSRPDASSVPVADAATPTQLSHELTAAERQFRLIDITWQLDHSEELLDATNLRIVTACLVENGADPPPSNTSGSAAVSACPLRPHLRRVRHPPHASGPPARRVSRARDTPPSRQNGGPHDSTRAGPLAGSARAERPTVERAETTPESPNPSVLDVRI